MHQFDNTNPHVTADSSNILNLAAYREKRAHTDSQKQKSGQSLRGKALDLLTVQQECTEKLFRLLAEIGDLVD